MRSASAPALAPSNQPYFNYSPRPRTRTKGSRVSPRIISPDESGKTLVSLAETRVGEHTGTRNCNLPIHRGEDHAKITEAPLRLLKFCYHSRQVRACSFVTVSD